jgi:hypothetical protein
VTRLLKAQLKVVTEERKALVEQERQSIEKLITTISATINRDLPKRIEEILVREVTGLSQAVGNAVETAITRTLSKELVKISVRVTTSVSTIKPLSLSVADRAIQECVSNVPLSSSVCEKDSTEANSLNGCASGEGFQF